MYGDPHIKAFRLPEQDDAFSKAKSRMGESHVFRNTDGQLVEVEYRLAP